MKIRSPTGDLLSPWHPMSDSKDIKVIGKFLEELGEGVASSARSLIQGIEEAEPVTGRLNREWLEDEVADVIGNALLVIRHFNLDMERIQTRAERKMVNLQTWHDGA